MDGLAGTSDVFTGPGTLNAASPVGGGDSDDVRYDARVYSLRDPSISVRLENVRPKRLIENTQWKPGDDGVEIVYCKRFGLEPLIFALGEELVTGPCQ